MRVGLDAFHFLFSRVADDEAGAGRRQGRLLEVFDGGVEYAVRLSMTVSVEEERLDSTLR